MLERPVQLAHDLLAGHVRAGDIVIDATAGRGHDTVFLCDIVGDSGYVFAIDIQRDAVSSTRARLQDLGFEKRATVMQAGHQDLQNLIDPVHQGKVSAVCFNLGYLPGSDKETITEADSTISALEQSAALLRSGGLITVVVYPGHRGGKKESEAVLRWCTRLNQQHYTCVRYDVLNQVNDPPYLIAVEKLGGDD